ncbi:hypothetical protein LV779_19255 [Streptomyces thinghirensis]|nr:hypothetical protein [Streptomyces thinghirensis]
MTECFAVWCKFLEEIAAQQPLVAVLEDLHLADDLLLDFVGYLTDHVGGVPIPSHRHRPARADADTTALGRRQAERHHHHPRPTVPCGERAAAQRAHRALSAARAAARPAPRACSVDPDGFGAALIRQIGGNPLFAGEFVRDVPRLQAEGEPGVPAGPEHGRPPLPQSVYTVIAARLDRLAPEEKEVLHNAPPVFGNKVWVEAVAALLENTSLDVAANPGAAGTAGVAAPGPGRFGAGPRGVSLPARTGARGRVLPVAPSGTGRQAPAGSGLAGEPPVAPRGPAGPAPRTGGRRLGNRPGRQGGTAHLHVQRKQRSGRASPLALPA